MGNTNTNPKGVDESKAEFYYSRGVLHFTMGIVEQYFDLIPGSRLIISVGSGNGVVERMLAEKKKKVICIDPAFNEWLSVPDGLINTIAMQPNYLNVDEALKQEPLIMRHATLFLNWCYPTAGPYDIRAVTRIKPMYIVCVYDENRISGSTLFHKDIKNCKYGYIPNNYKIVCTTRKICNFHDGFAATVMVLRLYQCIDITETLDQRTITKLDVLLPTDCSCESHADRSSCGIRNMENIGVQNEVV